MRGWHLQTPIALILAGLWGFGVYFGDQRGDLRFLDRLESTMTDLRTLVRGARVAPDPVIIVAIDDALVKQGSYPVARGDLARIVEAIARLQPKVIAVDLLLVDRGPDEGDEALARSLAGRRTAIAAAAVFPEARQSIAADNDGPLARLPRAEKFLLPLQKFADVAEIGIVNVATDRSGIPRSIPMLFRTSDRIEMSFPLRVAALAIGKEPTIEPNRLVFDQRSISTDVDHALPISFYGPRRTIRTVSAAAVLAGEIAADAIQDRIVVIGATVTGGGDFFPTPFDPVMPGVEVISTAITHLIAGDGILRDQSVRLADGVVAVVLPMVLVGLLAWRRSVVGLVAAAAVVLIWAGANLFVFSHGIWLSAAVPIAAAAPPAILFAAVQLWSGRRRAQYFAMRNELLEQFQAPGVQEWLARDPNFLNEPVRQNAAIVFIDLSGFTSLSERLGPAAIRDLLKNFHALVDTEAVSCGGMITSFLGDGAMILFGLPQAVADDAFRAAECSVGLCVSAEQWLSSLPPSVAARLGFKVGAHFGEIVASRLGGGSYHHITATGDTVNVASRLMEVAAGHGVELAASNELLRAAGRDCALYKSGVLTGPSNTRIRGRSGSLAVWLWRSDLAAQGGEGLSSW
jgi:adenylate cyclase